MGAGDTNLYVKIAFGKFTSARLLVGSLQVEEFEN